MVKFTKEQIQALAQIEVKANEYFDEDMKKASGQYQESDRSRVVRCYVVGILHSIIRDGAIYGV